jgi:hypothetical protein
MAKYDFEKLSDDEFEDFSNALCAKYISRGTNIFGSGTDGGREATYRGRMTYPLDADATGQWNGYLVVQCKQKKKLSTSLKLDADWAINQLDEEMKMYETARVEREKPEYFLFITNVELSAKLKTGGKDRFLKRLEYWKEKYGIKEAGVWDRDKLSNLLSGSQEIACRYGQLLPGDLIDAATKFFLAHNTDIKTALSLFLQNELLEDQYVSLKQAGQKTDEAPSLARVFVDLRAMGLDKNGRKTEVYAADAIQWASDRPVAPSRMDHERNRAVEELTPSEGYIDETTDEIAWGLIESQHKILRWKTPSRFVIIGGPGQGKSTLVQYLAQRHRTALLNSGVFTVADSKVKEATTAVEDEANEAGCGLPKHPRLPFRIILEKFASDLANGEVASVMDYMVATVQRSSEQPFVRADAEQLLKEMPLLVAFDGLDEVPAVSNRKELLRAIRRFLTEIATKDADVLIVATTRPQGYSDEFDPSDYTHLSLAPLKEKEALNYAKKLVEAKYPGRKAIQRDILHGLDVAAKEKAIARLMESPLQVTIMAILVESLDKLPRERFVLFAEYYDIIYKREQSRGGKLARILHRYRSRIEVLHDRIGLRLQVEGETEGGTNGKTERQGRISGAEFRNVIYDILKKDGHEGEALESLAKEFEDVALDRLVFIVQLQADSYGFEVRSLQEFAASRELMRVNEYNIVRERLLAIAPIPYWRNTALFAIGQVFARGDAYGAMIGQLYLDLNNEEDDILLSRTLAGSRLALDVIEEGIGEERPVYYRGFLDQALRLLMLPYEAAAERLARLYESEHEARYRKATLAALGVGGAGVQLAPMELLAEIVRLKPRVEWAKLLLQERWPSKLDDARTLLEQIADKLTWEPWQIEAVEKVARESSVEWVSRHLSGRTKGHIKWVNAASKITRNPGEVKFYANELKPGEGEPDGNEAEVFEFKFNPTEYSSGKTSPEHSSAEVLDLIAEAKPHNAEWAPNLLCRAFLLNPSSATLADSIEKLVTSPTYVHKRAHFYGLPWQLSSIINDADSKEEALIIAQRARDGKLGDTQDWVAAEKRWAEHGCTPADFQVFSDEDWPFTAEIAVRGIQPFASFSTSYAKTANDSTARGLLEAFITTSRRARPGVASAFLFSRECTRNRDAAFAVAVPTLLDIVNACEWKIEGSSVLMALEPELDWLANVSELDAIGKRLTLIRRLPFMEEKVLTDADFSTILANTKLLATIKPVKEGIIRMLAAVLVMYRERVEEVALPIPFEALSPQGRVSLVALHLFSKTTTLPIEELKQQILNNWQVLGPNGRNNEMPDVIISLISRERLSKYAIELLSQLIAEEVVDVESKTRIILALINQTQHRESGFGSKAYKEKLQIEA